MSIRFAAARSPGRLPACLPIARALARRSVERAANDNDNDKGDAAQSDKLLHAALRHFAEHGLGAARAARAQAEHAFFAGDRQAYDWWLAVTRTLDQRLAIAAEHALSIKEIS